MNALKTNTLYYNITFFNQNNVTLKHFYSKQIFSNPEVLWETIVHFWSLSIMQVYFDPAWLVRGVSFSVEMGEIFTLIGPTGSGKLIIATRGRIMPLLTQGAALRNIGILGWHLVVTLEFDPKFDGIKM